MSVETGLLAFVVMKSPSVLRDILGKLEIPPLTNGSTAGFIQAPPAVGTPLHPQPRAKKYFPTGSWPLQTHGINFWGLLSATPV